MTQGTQGTQNPPRGNPAPAAQALRAWFEAVISQNYRLLFATAYRVLSDSQEAEDAVQTAALKAFQRLGSLQDRAAVVAWLARIAKHTALDMVKKGGVHRESTVGEPAVFDRPVESETAGRLVEEDRKALMDAVNELPESLAVVVTLRHLEDLDTNEVAERLQIQPNAARVRLFRAYERLRAHPKVRSLFGWEGKT